jgi:hypothetical protein
MESQNCLSFFLGLCLPIASFLGYQTYQSYKKFRQDFKSLQNNLMALNGLTYLNSLMGVVGHVVTIVANIDEHLKTRQSIHNNRILYQLQQPMPRPVGRGDMERAPMENNNDHNNNNDA